MKQLSKLVAWMILGVVALFLMYFCTSIIDML